jgi:hypothetical protein
MAHIDEGMLQAYLDDELIAARAEIDAHLAACTECAAELARLRAASQLFAAALQGADTKAPTYAARQAVFARRPQPIRVPVDTRRRLFGSVPLARAAMLLVGLAAVGSAAIPGSPVRALISDALRMIVGDTAKVPMMAPDAAETSEPVFERKSDLAAALSIQPAQGKVRIVLTNVAENATLRIRLIDSDRAAVQASGAAAQARFRTGPGRIEVVGINGGEVAIDLPRRLVDARVEVDGRLIFQKERGQLHLNEPATTGANSEFIFKP